MASKVCLQIRSNPECFDHYLIFLFKDFQVLCSFCETELTSGRELMEHLMMCGNKTDQCPNCRKYVRRAIFAYHYENNCANPDEPSTDDNNRQTAQPGKFRGSFFIDIKLSRRKNTSECEMSLL